MDTKALRQKVLDLAIRGKLVPQDPNDEPASVLLERIRQQKQQMVKDGKLKAKDIKNDTIIFVGEDNLHYEKFADGSVKCIEDEIPFELPEGWEWVRLQSFVSFIGGSQPPKSTFEYTATKDNIRLIQIRDYKTNKFLTFIPRSKARRFCSKDDVMIGRYGPPIFQILRGLEGSYNVALMKAVADPTVMLNDYLYYMLQDGELLKTLESLSDRTCGQDGIDMYELNRYIVGIPPLGEQQRIIQYLVATLPIIDNMAHSKDELRSLIDQTKAKILDLAIRGQLVPQDPSDEPASVLLDRIRAEKEELIKQGKIKRDKKESVIFKGEDNSYYDEMPDSWTVTTLSSLTHSLLLNDGDWILSENMVPEGEIKLIQLGSVGVMKYIDKGFKYLSEGTFRELGCSQIYPGFMLINRIVSDKMCVCILPPIDGKLITAVDTCWIAPKEEWYSLKYLMYALSSRKFQTLVMLNSAGTTRKRISKYNLVNLPLALPPLREQHRIVDAVENAFAQLDIIADFLS